jgi:hypothetical protein
MNPLVVKNVMGELTLLDILTYVCDDIWGIRLEVSDSEWTFNSFAWDDKEFLRLFSDDAKADCVFPLDSNVRVKGEYVELGEVRLYFLKCPMPIELGLLPC